MHYGSFFIRGFDALHQVTSRDRLLRMDDLRRCTLEHHLAALAASVRSHIDDPIRLADHIEVVLDNDHRIAGIHEAVHNRK